jgi:kynureninase
MSMHKLDFTALRQQFPLMEERTYLATHTLGPLPKQAYLDVESYLQSLYLGRRVFSTWLERYEEMFRTIELLLNATPGSVAIVPSSTAAQAAIAGAISPDRQRNRIIISDLDFPSGRYLWQSQVERGFEIVEVNASALGQIAAADIIAQIDERTAVVAVSLVSYINSARLEIEPIIQAAHAVGAIVILDVYQAVGVIPIDVGILGADVVVGGANKWLCGGLGLAFAYIEPSLAERLIPAYPGWFAHLQPATFADTFTPALGARRFQQGATSFEPIYTSRAGLEFILDVGVENIHRRNIELTNYLIDLADRYGIKVLTPRAAEYRGGTLCLEVENAETIVNKLADLGIDIDSRASQKVRISPHCCNTETDCQLAIERLAAIAGSLCSPSLTGSRI